MILSTLSALSFTQEKQHITSQMGLCFDFVLYYSYFLLYYFFWKKKWESRRSSLYKSCTTQCGKCGRTEKRADPDIYSLMIKRYIPYYKEGSNMLNRSHIRWYKHAEEGTTKIRKKWRRKKRRLQVRGGMWAESGKKSSKSRYENAGLSRLGEENIIFHLLQLLLLFYYYFWNKIKSLN